MAEDRLSGCPGLGVKGSGYGADRPRSPWRRAYLMPGAQPRRTLATRLGASVARRTYVPAGVPGVHAVVRVARWKPEVSYPWVCPPVQTASVGITHIFRTTASDDPIAPYTVGESPLSLDRSAGAAGEAFTGFDGWTTICVVLDPSNLGGPPISPTPPAGYVVEYDGDSELLTALLRGSLSNHGWLEPGHTPIPSTAGVWEIPYSTLVPGQDVGAGMDPYDTGPTQDPVGGANVFSTSVLNDDSGTPGWEVQEFETPPQTFPSPVQRIGWKISTTDGAFESPMAHSEITQILLWGPLSDPMEPGDPDPNLEVVFTYKPPCYRFVPEPVVPNGWTASETVGSGWVWDAGLYQHSIYGAMAGYPLTRPAGAHELWWFVEEAGSDHTDPMVGSVGNFGYQGILSDDTHDTIIFPGGTEPAAGAHLWVVWYGPDYDTSTDPPPTVDPATLVPASFAEFGTG